MNASARNAFVNVSSYVPDILQKQYAAAASCGKQLYTDRVNMERTKDKFTYKGDVAIVIGGTLRLSFCVARRLCQDGAKVVLVSSTQEKGDSP